MNTLEIKNAIYNRSMNFFQITAVSICVLISFIDGFDVLTIAFIAPSLAEQWALRPDELGVLFSSGLAGMVVGALVISPLGDKFGRRFVILTCLLILSLGMFASGLSTTQSQLLFARFFTGLGMGAILPGINTVVAEYSSNRYRSLAISIMAAGYTVGALVGGVISIYLINHFGWRYVFYFGGMFSCLMIPLVLFRLPESLDFLLNKKKNLNKLNKLLHKLGLSVCENYPMQAEQQNWHKQTTKLPLLLSAPILRATILLCLSNFMLMCSFYFLANWTPKILVSLGYSKELSISGSILMNICGIVGGLLLGWLSKKHAVQKITATLLVIAFITVVAFGFSANILAVLLFLIAFIGFSISGAMAGLYATAPIVFPPQIRSTGTGIVLGLARLGATLGPYLAGILIAAELPRSYYYFILATPLLFAAICIINTKSHEDVTKQ